MLDIINIKSNEVSQLSINTNYCQFISLIHMLLNARKLFLILSPITVILITTIVAIYTYRHLQEQKQSARLELKQQHRAVAAQATISSLTQIINNNTLETAPSKMPDTQIYQPDHYDDNNAQQQNSSEILNYSKSPTNIIEQSNQTATSSLPSESGIAINHKPPAKRRQWRQEPMTSVSQQSRMIQSQQSNLATAHHLVNSTSTDSIGNSVKASKQQQQPQPSRNMSEPNTFVTLSSLASNQSSQSRVRSGTKHSTQSNNNHHHHHIKPIEIDILLDRQNFILHNRCSMDPLYVRMNKRTRRALIEAKQLKLPTKQSTNLDTSDKKQQSNSSKIKLLSMVITVEESPHNQPEESDRLLGADNTTRNQEGLRNKSMNEVRLRANLTELYICFDENGKLEAKVSRPNIRSYSFFFFLYLSPYSHPTVDLVVNFKRIGESCEKRSSMKQLKPKPSDGEILIA